ncbi:hypothetical protein ACH40E_21585 [Streptomyces acidicola]|uniref:hypothetical protein n=1 Tax=Streptomyces acidicola TaxID=2596892 RepID=UPI00379324AB
MRGSGPTGSGNTYNGPVNQQFGNYNTQIVHNNTVAGPPLDVAADELARAVKEQWQKEARFRRLLDPPPLPVRWHVTSLKLAGRLAGATAEGKRARFPPVPGLQETTREVLREGGGLPELHEVYGGLASGRLLLVGLPAVGKTAAVLLLLLDALVYREGADAEGRARIPVPVLLSLEGWNPAEETATDWAAGRLSREYPLFRSREGREQARDLLENGRVALFLDGLDEVRGKLRGAMVSALEEVTCRLVLVSRREEAVQSGKRARLGGAIALEIESVRPEDAAEYLLDSRSENTPHAWQELTRRLLDEPGSAVAQALTRPLEIALVRDVYADNDPVDELLDDTRFPTRRSIEDHLLDHLVTAVYSPKAGKQRPRHSPETAERTLRFLAARLTDEGTQDLRWWHIPAWAKPRPRAVFLGVVVSLFYGAVGAVVLWQTVGPLWTCLLVPPTVCAAGFVVGSRHMNLSDHHPLPSAGWRDIFPPAALATGLGIWLFSGTTSWLLFRYFGDAPGPAWLSYVSALPLGFGAAMATGDGYELIKGTVLGTGSGPEYDGVRERLRRSRVTDTRSVGPRDVWRHHSRLRLVLGILVGGGLVLLVYPYTGLRFGWWAGSVPALLVFLWAALYAGPVSNLAVATALTAAQLSAREGTPVRLMSFLEDARRRNILRATGPVYQFRHARLQERLARSAVSDAGRD